MSSHDLPKVRDAEKESLYGYVYSVSGPGKWTQLFFPVTSVRLLFAMHDKCY